MIRVMDSVEIIFDWIRDSSEIGDIKRFENLGTMNYYLFLSLLTFIILYYHAKRSKNFLCSCDLHLSREVFYSILKYSHSSYNFVPQ